MFPRVGRPACSCRFIYLDELGIWRRGDSATMRSGWEARRVTGASHSHALLYYAFLRFFSPLPSSVVVSPRTFRFSSSSSSDLANARPSFPSPSRPPVLLVSLAACAVVNISPRQVDRRGSNLLCYSLHTRVRIAFAASLLDEKEACGPRTKNAFAYRDAILRKLHLQLNVCRRNCEREGR